MKRKGWRVSPEFQSMMCFLVPLLVFVSPLRRFVKLSFILQVSFGNLPMGAKEHSGMMSRKQLPSLANRVLARIFLNFW